MTQETPASSAKISSSRKPLLAFVGDAQSRDVIRQCFDDLGFANAEVISGGVEMAAHDLTRRASPQLLVVDISGAADPIAKIDALAEVCDPDTGVIVIGDSNDIALYRNLRQTGIVDYFYKPLGGDLFKRACNSILSGGTDEPDSHTGKLVLVIGVRGGAGATTVAVNAAWHLAESRQRKVALVDLDLHFGDAALQLDSRPTHALREALEAPERIDDVFLERGVIRISERFGLFASLESLGDRIAPLEDSVLLLIDELLPHYRYVFVDLPLAIAVGLPRLVRLPSVNVLVSTGSLVSARDAARWRQFAGPDGPNRSTTHVVNKQHANAGLPKAEFAKAAGAPPDIELPFLPDVLIASTLGLHAVAECHSLQHGLEPLYRRLSGEAATPEHASLLSRLLG